ncbi:MAG: BON domain-containing protein [Alphaproteobacteria bacterium]|nr:BON domain-containing protein [Alphaproteobacteria bacterium]MBM3628774.1 BON domain-containing protein [Alphaproteobacteria bacterium]
MRHAGLLPRVLPTFAVLALAGCIETAVVGGAAAVGSTALQDRGVKGAAIDLGIRSEINDLWFKDENGQVLMRDVNLQVQEGRVLVSGEVANADLRARAVQLAWKASGVREVLNEVEVGNSGGLRTYWTDSKIVRELEARMLLEKGVTSPNYSVESYNGTVFLIGVAQDQTELNRVLQLARNISSVKKVVNHVLLKDDPRRFRAPAS